MKLSIMQAGTSQPTYITCTGADFTAGSEIRADVTTQSTVSPGGTGSPVPTAPSCSLSSSGNTVQDNDATVNTICLSSVPGHTCNDLVNGDYRVVIFHIPSSSIMLDQVVTIS